MVGHAPPILSMKPIFLLVLLSLALLTNADGAPDAAKDDRGPNDIEQRELARAEFQRIDAELTKTFEEQVDSQASPALREALIAAQQAWKSFRDADAHYERLLYEGRPLQSTDFFKRLTHLTQQRIYQLKTPFAAGWVEPPKAPAK
jgi:uncharacterized protein YecT (DUF1311 family)